MTTKRTIKIGDKFNRLTAIESKGKDKHGRLLFLFKCECGNEYIGRGTEVKNGYTKSCGCLQSESSKQRATTHGMSDSPLYNRWASMKKRCYDKSYHAYHRYGGRGISVCEEWINDFQAFHDDMFDTFFEGSQLDRENNDGNYCKENCRWVTPKENSNNRSTYFNKTGHTGVYFREKTGKYTAYFHHNRKSIHVGTYFTIDEAVEARQRAIDEFKEDNVL